MAEIDEPNESQGRGGAGQGGAGGVTQLEFNQAMNDFKIMFPEMEEDVIECVLRANNGAVDSTIDQLLQLSSDVEKEKARVESPPASRQSGGTMLPGHSRPQNPNLLDIASSNNEVPPRYSATPPPSYHQAVPDVAASAAASMSMGGARVKNCNINRPQEQPNVGAIGQYPTIGWSTDLVDGASGNTCPKVPNNLLAARNKWNPPLIGPLPDTFLRIDEPRRWSGGRQDSAGFNMSSALLHQRMQENERLRKMSSREGIDPEQSQYLEDERIAILLQNEEFVRELQHNQEFMSALQMDAERSGHGLPEGPSVSKEGEKQDTDGEFMDMLKNMGKASRKKFDQLAGLFSRGKRKSSGDGSLVANPNRNSRDFLIRDDEYREFENDDTSGSERAESPAAWNNRRPNPTPGTDLRRRKSSNNDPGTDR